MAPDRRCADRAFADEIRRVELEAAKLLLRSQDLLTAATLLLEGLKKRERLA